MSSGNSEKTLKIAAIVGARPQFIKAAMVSKAMAKRGGIREILIHTGQHYDKDMSAIFFTELALPDPSYHLGIGSGPHGRQTGQMLAAIEEVLDAEQPDLAIVYGDTNSTLAASLAAAKLHIRVAHVEAGLRSFNRRMPEEINRVVADHLSALLFAPTEIAVQNLHREGIAACSIFRVGDVMYDAAIYYGQKAQATSTILDRYHLVPQGYILATVHRAENTDDAARLRNIFAALAMAAEEIPVIVPLHPRTKKALVEHVLSQKICCTEPVGYLDMIMLEKNARVVVTDSGGVQKEAFFYRVPCVTVREQTEWVELVEAGWNRLASPDDACAITQAVLSPHAPGHVAPDIYGDGAAATRIVETILRHGHKDL